MPQEIYRHIYNRGAHKEQVFCDISDLDRMKKLLYIANNDERFIFRKLPENVYSIPRRKKLVTIVAYCLMPNHFHIAIKSGPGNNVARFMQKLCTAYSCYFNRKYGHSGTVWQGPYKEKIVFDRNYIETLIHYIHLNPYGIKRPELSRSAKSEYLLEATKFSKSYPYSSFQDYLGIDRPEKAILS